jgi:homoserine kinase
MSEFTPFKVSVPATTANLGPGFDSFGMALHLLNRFHIKPPEQGQAESHTISIHPANCVDVSGVSLHPAENLFFHSMQTVFQQAQKDIPAIHIQIEAHIPLARGLGSSSSVIVGGVLAANELLKQVHHHPGLSSQQMVQVAHEIEGHPDNVAPALLGGTILCDEDDQNQVTTVRLPWPEDWAVCVVVPSYPLLTEKARAVLPKQVSMGDAIANLRKSALLTAALYEANCEWFSKGLEDRLHQPYRSALIPEFEVLKPLVQQTGGFGTVISGAGPTIAMFYPKLIEIQLLDTLKTAKANTKSDWRILTLKPHLTPAEITPLT